MKIFLFIIPLIFLTNDYQNRKACKIYCQQLKIIEQRLQKKEWQDLGKVNEAINFFEDLTGITSHSNGNYFGRYYPTKGDYINWRNWFKENKLRLYWDRKEQKIMLKPRSTGAM